MNDFDRLNPLTMDRARGFLSLAKRSDGSVSEGIPAVILAAFACEISLKGLGAGEGHDLLNLFHDLSDARQHWLCDRYAQEVKGNLEADLEKCRNLFVDLRYIHEKNSFSGDTGICYTLANFLIAAGHVAIEARADRQFISLEWTSR
ncbi:hypothetical protein ILP92_05305 [Maribius pontilimi]|uniref:Uncharacterized protein n=1 Tax=Palleronia pontilimi TaxID=1964209 RepID=A0A934I8C8_9RHOB|nr:hypothetical protein [Palleronia pontilimi]MBJ3762158.1 hypothetical protein [Palleronia pontilimi]